MLRSDMTDIEIHATYLPGWEVKPWSHICHICSKKRFLDPQKQNFDILWPWWSENTTWSLLISYHFGNETPCFLHLQLWHTWSIKTSPEPDSYTHVIAWNKAPQRFMLLCLKICVAQKSRSITMFPSKPLANPFWGKDMPVSPKKGHPPLGHLFSSTACAHRFLGFPSSAR
jgi:hypothetical protein